MRDKSVDPAQSGFTLIELVMVILLIAVLSISAIGLFSSSDDYVPTLARDTALSQARLAQEAAFSIDNVATPSSLVISHETQDGEDVWRFRVEKLGALMIEQSIQAGGNLFINGSILTLNSSQTIRWNQNAFLNDGNAREIRIEANNIKRMCISASGYAYASETACPI